MSQDGPLTTITPTSCALVSASELMPAAAGAAADMQRPFEYMDHLKELKQSPALRRHGGAMYPFHERLTPADPS